jgi:glycosyltransferase involved in cell wall biosynthesis
MEAEEAPGAVAADEHEGARDSGPGSSGVKVSIVTISFNQGAFLESAMRSVLAQTYPDVEYIVVDPGSTDGSRDIIARHRDRLATVVLEPDDGPADGLNRGFARATGDVFGYLNADDVLLPHAVTRAVAAIRANPTADVVYGHGHMIDEWGAVIRRFHSSRYALWRQAYGVACVMQQATFIRRDAFLATGGFNPANQVSWDAELLVDLALAGKRFRRIDEDWALFRIHPNSIAGSGGENGSGNRDPRTAVHGPLARQFDEDRDRLFEKVVGRPPRPSDRIRYKGARLLNWATDPGHVAIRLREVASESLSTRLGRANATR